MKLILEEIIEKAFEAGYQCRNNNGYKQNGTYQEDYNKFMKSIRDEPKFVDYIPKKLKQGICNHCGNINSYS
jgi:hypothetical protein